MSDDYIQGVQKVRDAFEAMHTQGYAKGQVNALDALYTSMDFVYGAGVLKEEQKAGYKIALDTVYGVLKLIEQDNEEKGH